MSERPPPIGQRLRQPWNFPGCPFHVPLVCPHSGASQSDFVRAERASPTNVKNAAHGRCPIPSFVRAVTTSLRAKTDLPACSNDLSPCKIRSASNFQTLYYKHFPENYATSYHISLNNQHFFSNFLFSAQALIDILRYSRVPAHTPPSEPRMVYYLLKGGLLHARKL